MHSLGAFLLVTLAVPGAADTPQTQPPTATGTTTTGKPRVVVLALEARGVDAAAAATVNSLVVVEAQRLGAFDVLSADDVRRALDFEAERTALGCDDQSCLAEIAGAMGASLVVFGDVGRIDGIYTVTLNLFDSASARALGRTSAQAKTFQALSRAMAPALRQLVEGYAAEKGLVLAPAADADAPLAPGVLVAAGGAAGAVVGAVLLGVGMQPWLGFSEAADVARTTDSQTTFLEASRTMDTEEAAYASWGQPLAVIGGAVVALSLAAAGGGAVWALTEDQ